MAISVCLESFFGDSPGSPVVKTPRFQCKGLWFDPWSGDWDLICQEVQIKTNKQTKKQLDTWKKWKVNTRIFEKFSGVLETWHGNGWVNELGTWGNILYLEKKLQVI